MDAFVHFAVGVSFALLVLGVANVSNQTEFLLVFVSGLWAMIPDGHWMLHEAGFTAAAAEWKEFHQSAVADLFWFHRYLDRHETGHPKVEVGIALGLLSVMVLYYYFVNNWRTTN